MAAIYKEYKCKTMLRMHKYVDNWFWESGSVSPYRACEHGCNYCDGRSKKYHASEDFDNIIHVKINSQEILRKELDRLFPKQKTLTDFGMKTEGGIIKVKPVIAISSGISDAYQPAERKYKLTRGILKLFLEYEVPTFVMTKSDLVLRDLDLLKKINDTTWSNVSFSLSCVDKKITAEFEPIAATPKRRLDAMKKIADCGILTGIIFMPVLPYISDSKKQLEETIKASRKKGAKYILAASMTMRDLQAERFYETLKIHYPELVEKYKVLYRKGYEPDGKYLKDLYQKIKILCKENDIQNYIPRYIPDMKLSKNLEVSTMLFLCAYFLSLDGERYRAEAFRRLAQTIEDMDEKIEDIYGQGRLGGIKGIGKNTKELIEEFLETGKCGYLDELRG
ncbi:MAG: radical SAM protein [Thermoplasmata archaeon]|nr:MAG: radical SAM protein [Thermoplasmata archaeon]